MGIQFYDITVRPLAQYADLERTLQHFTLSDQPARELLTKPRHLPVPTGMDIDDLEVSTPLDPHLAFTLFDVLYHRSWDRPEPQRRLFRASIVPDRTDVELILEMSDGYQRAFQQYLLGDAFTVHTARPVTTATFAFELSCGHPEMMSSDIAHIGEFATGLGVSLDIKETDNVLYSGDPEPRATQRSCDGIVTGPVKSVLSFQDFVTGNGLNYTLRANHLTLHLPGTDWQRRDNPEEDSVRVVRGQ